jgi:hypothetical protein
MILPTSILVYVIGVIIKIDNSLVPSCLKQISGRVNIELHIIWTMIVNWYEGEGEVSDHDLHIRYIK